MEIIYDILLDVAKIFVFFLNMVAIVVSAMILFKPKLAASLNSSFSKMFDTGNVSDSVDKSYDTTEAILKYRWVVGVFFLGGAIYTLKYLLMDFKEGVFIELVVRPDSGGALLATEMIVAFMKWFLIITAAFGVVTCLAILFKPEMFKTFSGHLDSSYSTQSIQDKLDSGHYGFDEWVIKNHLFVGGFLLLGSIFILVFLTSYFV
ncbi:MAG: hypothetical protein G3M78_05495 [Candidatus Nitrohelix vancouverensis]|uniref:Uncharacterized protein n=1 Tax=Candidatus Nitrohelix vancouverensis TaxID=2705534 RepID=A0A7T0C1K7_9BACT|nr:MAG: hypothetical protein G3M78_05495 [Candidatus Nitrohelix vancouverensis]